MDNLSIMKNVYRPSCFHMLFKNHRHRKQGWKPSRIEKESFAEPYYGTDFVPKTMIICHAKIFERNWESV